MFEVGLHLDEKSPTFDPRGIPKGIKLHPDTNPCNITACDLLSMYDEDYLYRSPCIPASNNLL